MVGWLAGRVGQGSDILLFLFPFLSCNPVYHLKKDWRWLSLLFLEEECRLSRGCVNYSSNQQGNSRYQRTMCATLDAGGRELAKKKENGGWEWKNNFRTDRFLTGLDGNWDTFLGCPSHPFSCNGRAICTDLHTACLLHSTVYLPHVLCNLYPSISRISIPIQQRQRGRYVE